MKITVTFTDSAGEGIPDGSAITFEGVERYELSLPKEIRLLDCDEVGCQGCRATHVKFTGMHQLSLKALSASSRPVWSIPEAGDAR